MSSNLNSDGDGGEGVPSLTNKVLKILGDSMGGPQFHVMDRVAEALRDHFYCDNCAIFWPTDSPDTLELIGSANKFCPRTGDTVVRITKGNAREGGLTSWLALRGEPLNLDADKLKKNEFTSRQKPNHLGPHDRFSIMSVPLSEGSGTMGMIKCENKLDAQSIPRPSLSFSEDELKQLVRVSVSVALAGRMTARPSEQRAAVDSIMRRIQGQMDLRSWLASILEETVNWLGAKRGEFAWWTAEKPGGDLVYAAIKNSDHAIIHESVALDAVVPEDSFIRKVFQETTRDHQLLSDVTRAEELGVPYFPADSRTRSEIAVRVDLFANPVGVLNLESFEAGFFRAEHVRVLRALAQQAALAVHQFQREKLVQVSLGQPFDQANGSPGVATGRPQVPSGSVLVTAQTNFIDESQILRPILAGMLEAFGFDRGIIYRFDRVQKKLFVAASVHDVAITVDPKTFFHSLDKQSFARSAFEGPIIQHDSEGPGVDQTARKGWNITGSMMGYPLRFREETRGCLVLWCRHRSFPKKPTPLIRLEGLGMLAAARIALWQAEQGLRSSKAFFQALAVHTDLIVFTKRIQLWEASDKIPPGSGLKVGDKKFVFDWANQGFLKWVGRESIEGLGLTDWELFPGSAHDYYNDDLLAWETGSVPAKEEWNERPSDGERRHVQVWKHRLPKDPLIGDLIQVVFWDRTEAKTLEDDHAKLLEEKNTLVRDIRHRASECIRHVCSILDDQSRQRLTKENIQECIARVETREAILALLYRRQTGSRIQMDEFLGQIAKEVQKCYSHPRIECKLEIEPIAFQERVAVHCGRIIAELVANSFRHGFSEGDAGTVTIRLTPQPPGDHRWLLQVMDDGKGTVPPMRPFPPSVIGLGLVEELVEKQLAGKLDLQPTHMGHARPGLSVLMTFSEVESQPAPVHDPNAPDGRGRVLLVDDDPILGVDHAVCLKREHYHVLGPANVHYNAVACLTHDKPDVVVLDVAFGPEPYQGLKLAREIRSFSEVPILFLTRHDHSDQEVQKALREIKGTHYLQNVGNVNPHLLAKVQELMSLGRPPSTVFVCYPHQRRTECAELCEVLKAALDSSAGPEQVRVHDESENTSSLVTWTDRNIQSGDSWEDEVDRALKRCAVGILLIDQAWVNSTFIQRKEFPAILKKLQGQKDFLLLPVKMTSYYIKPEIETMLSKTQFVGGTETVAIDALGNTEYEVKNRRKDVWVEIARRVAEFKKSRAAAPPA